MRDTLSLTYALCCLFIIICIAIFQPRFDNDRVSCMGSWSVSQYHLYQYYSKTSNSGHSEIEPQHVINVSTLQGPWLIHLNLREEDNLSNHILIGPKAVYIGIGLTVNI